MTATPYLKQLTRWASVAFVAFAAFGSSQAADPVAGSALYMPDCSRSGCHGADPFGAPSNKIQNGRNSSATIDSAISNVGVMNSLRTKYPSGGAALANMAAYLGNSPASVTFGSTAVGSTSTAQTVTVRAGINLTSIVITTSAEFTRSGGTCGTTLNVGLNCTVLVSFSPTATGSRTGTLSISHNRNAGNPALIALSGTATGGVSAPVASAAPTSVSFTSTVIGTPSAPSTVTLSNTGTAALNLSNITATGDFAFSGGTTNPCTVGVPVASGSNCTARVVFTPTATGTRTGTLTFSHNAGTGSTAVSLSGTGANAPAPVVSLSPTSVAFGGQQVGTSSAARAVVLTNSGNAALTISSIGLAAPFSATHNCPLSPSTLAAAASCTINTVFTPTALGGASASLSITDTAAGSPHAVPLSGNGSATPLPVLAWSAASLSLPSSPTGAAMPTTRSAMLTNQGPGSITLSSLVFSGANAAEFSLETGTTCVANAVLAASATCNVVVGFTPAATGIRSASLLVASSGTNPPALALSGSGTAPAVAQLTVVPSSVAITAAPSSMGEQTIAISNTGTAPLNIMQISVGSGPFTVQPASTGGCAAGAFTLQPNSSCNVTVTWTNTSTTSDTGTLQVMGSTGLLQTIGASAQRASPQAVTPPGTGTTPTLEMQNQGAGGCTISQGRSPMDPVLWLLAAAAGGVLWRRRRAR